MSEKILGGKRISLFRIPIHNRRISVSCQGQMTSERMLDFGDFQLRKTHRSPFANETKTKQRTRLCVQSVFLVSLACLFSHLSPSQENRVFCRFPCIASGEFLHWIWQPTLWIGIHVADRSQANKFRSHSPLGFHVTMANGRGILSDGDRQRLPVASVYHGTASVCAFQHLFNSVTPFSDLGLFTDVNQNRKSLRATQLKYQMKRNVQDFIFLWTGRCKQGISRRILREGHASWSIFWLDQPMKDSSTSVSCAKWHWCGAASVGSYLVR